MELSEIAALLDTVPTWIWVVVGFVVVVVIFGESMLWDYEVKFPRRDGTGRAKVEFECGSKRGSRIECVFELEPVYQNQAIEIVLNGAHVFTVPAKKNTSSRFFFAEKVNLNRPNEGDEVVVRIGGSDIFSGPLVQD